MKRKANLPEDLIVEILWRLPVKSLLRFKCVCKSWLILISDPQFAKSHFDLAAAPTHRFLFKLSECSEFKSIDIEAEAPLHDDSASVIFNIPLPSSALNHRELVGVVGSCRGFILLKFTYLDFFCFIIWNPSTGLHRQILRKRTGRLCEYLFGFGYDSSTDDYVIVNVILSQRCTEIECFSLRTNSWSCTERTVKYRHRFVRNGVVLNGALHWLVKPYDNVSVIIAFDVMERRLSEIPLPLDLAIEMESNIFHFMVREGCLCLCSLGWDYTIMPEMWTMKEYKVQSSWTKSLVLCTNYYKLFCVCLPAWFTGNGEILASCDNNTLVRLNDKGEVLEHCRQGTEMESFFRLLHCGMYRESLLPIPMEFEEATEDEQEQK